MCDRLENMVWSFNTDHNIDSLLNYASFMNCDLVDCRAKRFHVVQPDRSDCTDHWLHDICGVYGAAEPHFEHSDITLLLLEVLKSHERCYLEEGEWDLMSHRGLRYPVEKVYNVLFTNHAPIDLNPFSEAANVRGRKEACPETSLA